MFFSLTKEDWIDSLTNRITFLKKESACARSNLSDLLLISTIVATKKRTGESVEFPNFTVVAATQVSSVQYKDSPISSTKSAFNRVERSPKSLENIEGRMADMAQELKETANRVHQTLLSDKVVLGLTSTLQDQNHSLTKGHKESAVSLRKSSRFGFLTSLIMILISVLIFLLLIPLIWFT